MNIELRQLDFEVEAINADNIKTTDSSPKIANIAIEKIHLEYKKLKQEIKILTKKKDLYKQSLIDYMDKHELLYSKEGEELHTYKTYYKDDFDKKACQILYPDVYKKLITTTEYRRFI